MRRRLVAAIGGVAIVALLLYAVPRAFLLADMVRDHERDELERSADLVAAAVALRLAEDLDVDEDVLGDLLDEDEQAVVRLPGGRRVTAGPELRRVVAVSEQIDGGAQLTLRLSSAAVDERVASAFASVVAIAALVVVVAVGLALVLARRLSAPFVSLVEHADRIAVDDAEPAPRTGIPEADALASALDRSRDRVAAALRHEREFSSNASHQLRTPLAALRLRVEDVTLWPETSPSVRAELEAALGEIDRLADTVSDLLELARSGGIGAGGVVALDEVVGAAVERWQAPFAAAGRQLLAAAPSGEVAATSSSRAIGVVLDVLFENALSHGAGTVEVSVLAVDGHVAVRVADEGCIDGSVAETAFERSVRSSTSSGSGIGLALARTVAESAGGRLHIVRRDPTVFELLLPGEVLLVR